MIVEWIMQGLRQTLLIKNDLHWLRPLYNPIPLSVAKPRNCFKQIEMIYEHLQVLEIECPQALPIHPSIYFLCYNLSSYSVPPGTPPPEPLPLVPCVPE